MIYENIVAGNFLSRPNRFIAQVNINGITETVHVKNTGRCKELLTDNAKVLCQHFANTSRKTAYDLISVYKGDRLINMDSQAPNKVFGEWAQTSGYFGEITYIKPECKYKNSRFDYYIETKDRKIFVEVKGVTLENNGVVLFPDAPTERGIKHINELIDCIAEGYDSYIFFIIQMEKCKYFVPNRAGHPEFADVLLKGVKSGIKVKALKCNVTPESLVANSFIDVCLD